MHSAQDFSEINKKPTQREQWRSIPRLAKIAFQTDRRDFCFMVAGMLVEAPLSAGIVFSTAKIVDTLGGTNPANVWLWIGILIGLWMFKNLGDVVYINRLEMLRAKMILALEERLLTHMALLPYTVLENASYQSLATLMNRKLSSVIVAFENVFDFLATLVGLVGMLTVIFYVPWQVVLVLSIAILVRFYASRKVSVLNWGIFDFETREGRRANYYRNTIENPRTLLQAKSVGLVEYMIRQWRALAETMLKKRIHERNANSFYNFLTLQIDNIGLGLGMMVLAPEIIAGAIPISAFVVFTTGYSRILPNMRELSRKYSRILTDAPMIPLMFRLLDIPRERETGRLIRGEQLRVRFDNVSFHYPESKIDVLKAITFEFKAGDRIALVGLNGAGKSTILKLLMGVYQPTSGRILINDIPLEDVKPSVWRRLLAVMGQESQYYSDTVTDQVWYGDREEKLDRTDLLMALDASGFSEIAKELPEGEKTFVGKTYAMPEDRAVELSGGQNQILTIARTLYRNARIYIFDEPTSAVDAEKEEAFFSRLPETLAGKAIIFVSHRFSTLRRAKRILVLEDGRLIEDGTHEELLELKGRYAELFTLQAKNYQ
jgi:ATP-binding cassette subfamily B protein